MWYYDDQFAQINTRLDALTNLVKQLLQQENKMAVDVTALTAEVAKNTTVEGSVVTLLGNLTAMLKAIPPSSDPVTQAAIDAAVATLTGNDTALAGAVVANTPAVPAQARGPR